MSTWSIISWLAVVAGMCSIWICGRSHNGWLLSIICNLLWISYNVYRGIWAGLVASLVYIVISIRNYRIGQRNVVH